MNDEQYFKHASNNFDLDEDVKISVWTAQWLVSFGFCSLEQALFELEITFEQYKKYCDCH